jgi:redox-sensitive bicupin YhaK (pirin superfamily)
MIPPRYQDTPPEKIPVVKSEDQLTTIKVIAGKQLGVDAYIETRFPILYLDLHLQPNAVFEATIPTDFNSFAYVYSGSGSFGPKENTVALKEGQLGQLSLVADEDASESSLHIETKEGCRVLVLGGRPLKEPIARYGPFVMTTQEEIHQALADVNSGRFGKIEGADERRKLTEAARKKLTSNGKFA